MKFGLYIRLLGRPGTDPPPPTWPSILEQARAAEGAGFDLVVLEDALLYPAEDGNLGVWEAIAMAAALAAATSRIAIGHAVLNSPYRTPARVAAIAATLDEIAGGRYVLGIGAGNTPDDYPLFGIDADPRYARFAEAIEIIHSLLRNGRTSFAGRYYTVDGAEIVLRGPRPDGPPIVIAAGKPKMMRLAARFGDEWNWWTAEPRDPAGLRPLLDELDAACADVGRDPATLRRSVDVFSVASHGGGDGIDGMLGGSVDEVVDGLAAIAELGFDELRLNLKPPPGVGHSEAIGWLGEAVGKLRAGVPAGVPSEIG